MNPLLAPPLVDLVPSHTGVHSQILHKNALTFLRDSHGILHLAPAVSRKLLEYIMKWCATKFIYSPAIISE